MRNISQSIAVLTLLTSSVIGLSACSTPQVHYPPMNLRNQINVSETVERLELYARPDGFALSARDSDAVAGFIRDYAYNGDGPLYMNVPTHIADTSGAAQTQEFLRGVMAQSGVNPGAVQTGQYYVAENGPAPVVVSYRKLEALTEDCARMGDLMNTYNNQPYDGFGCAQSSNLAAMISDPRQFLEPYTFGPSDSQRRRVVYDRYIKGENPASDLPDRQELSAEDE